MKIEMTLLSDAIPGSGEGIAGIIDSDIVKDELGVPYIPAKRIKGILKESARDLLDAGQMSKMQIDSLFGVSGSENGTELKISDGTIADYDDIRAFLKAVRHNFKKAASLFNSESVLSYYSYTRSQTTIKNGVAKEDTLRTFRILKRGLIFTFDLVCPDRCKEDLESVCKVTRSFGTSRTRGTGAIKLCLIDDVQNIIHTPNGDDETQIQPDEMCEIILDIHNKSQLLVSQQVGKTQESEDYIPGSFILGALAGRFISEYTYSNPHKDENFRTIFLSGQVRFGDAYPCIQGGGIYWPCPQSLVREKNKDIHFDLTDPDKIELIIQEKKQTKGKIGPFVSIGRDDVEYLTPETEVEYHHQRPNNRSVGHATENDGEFFQFNVIKSDQFFRASIIGEYRYLKLLFDLLKSNNIMYLGKSKTAQYGKCECTASIGKKSASSKKWENGESAVITLISDMILHNEFGMTVADPELLVQEIRAVKGFQKDSDKIKLVSSFTDSKKIGGFLGVWNMPKIQAVSLVAGSEIICQNDTGEIIDAEELERYAYGSRTEEGFGRIKVDWHNKNEIRKVPKAISTYRLPDSFSSEVKELVKHILDKELELSTISYATIMFKKHKKTLSNSLIGRLKLIINQAPKQQDLETIQFGKRPWEQIKSLKDCWHLKIDDSARNLIVDFFKFSLGVQNTRKIQEIDNLGTIMGSVGLPDYLQTIPTLKQFVLFKLFANHFLTLARLDNREKEAQNG